MNILEKIYYNAIKYPKNIIIKNITNEQFWNNILKYSNYYCKKVDKKDIIIVENTQDEYFLYTLFSLNLLGAIVLPLDRNTSYNIMLDTLNKIGASKILKKDDIKNSKILNYTN